MGECPRRIIRLMFSIFSILNGCRAALIPSAEDNKKSVVDISLLVARFFGVVLLAPLKDKKSSNFPVIIDLPYLSVGNRKYLISSEQGIRTVKCGPL